MPVFYISIFGLFVIHNYSFVHNLQMGPLSWSVSPMQTFPALFKVTSKLIVSICSPQEFIFFVNNKWAH